MSIKYRQAGSGKLQGKEGPSDPIYGVFNIEGNEDTYVQIDGKLTPVNFAEGKIKFIKGKKIDQSLSELDFDGYEAS